MTDIANMLTEITGKQVIYHNPSTEAYLEMVIGPGVPEMC
jgi:hypothetical protein